MKNKKSIASLVLLGSLLMSSYGLNKPSDNIDTEVTLTNPTESNMVLDENTELNNVIEDKVIVKDEDLYTVQTYGCMLYDTIIYKDPINFEEISLINKYQKVYVIGNYKGYSKIRYNIKKNQCITGFVPASWIQLFTDMFIEVNLSEQRAKVYEDNLITVDAPVVTGKPSYRPTGEGCFEIYHKGRDVTLSGTNADGTPYSSFVDYWMPFNGGIGLHDAEYHTDDGFVHGWREASEFGGNTYINSGSHGCVNLCNKDAKYIYENSEVGTKVLVHK